MMKSSRLMLALSAVALTLAGAPAQAQYQYPASYSAVYQPQPLYPYAVPQANAYAVQPQYAPRAYPYVGASASAPRILRRTVRKTDPALVEELRQRIDRKNPVISKRIVVRERPVVIEHRRVVDDPPVVITREIDETRTQLVPQTQRRVSRNPLRSHAEKTPVGTPSSPRVIRAEAEVTILGPDRMSIRLFRSRGEAAPPPVSPAGED
jgi:hypothetical protein